VGTEGPRKIRQILRVIAEKGGTADATSIARGVWPDSPFWSVLGKRPGRSGRRELGARLTGAMSGILGRLETLKVVRRLGNGWWAITPSGLAYLQSPEKPLGAWPSPAPRLPPWPWPPGTRVNVLASDCRFYPATVVECRYDGWVCVQCEGTGFWQWVAATLVAAA